jgi:pSer/pThr/pTyr-binding forkhead associated (FHA) protein
MKRWFEKWRKVAPARPKQAAAAYVDSDETIVINMSAEEHFAPDEVRVQFDPDSSEPEPTTQAPAAPQSGPAPTDAASDVTGDHTQIWTASDAPSKWIDTSAEVAQSPPAVSGASMAEPTTSAAAIDVALTAGLLILTEGPQRGRVFAVNLGRNRIGRGPENDIVLDTGDVAISKEDHVVIAADPKNRRFFLVPGNSTNLAYVDDQPLLESCEITDKAVIQIGETKLVFIQLFGNYLDWS